MASVKVFGSPASTEVQRVLACLFEKDVEFQLVKMDSFKGPKRVPDYLKMQPGGQALTYQDEEKTLVESRAICRHIVERFKNTGNRELYGEGSLERAQIEQWLETESQKFDPPTSDLVFYLSIVPTFPETLNRVEIPPLEPIKKNLDKILRGYDKKLADQKFLAGNKFTLADLSHLPNTQMLMNIKETSDIFKKHDNVAKWWDRISAMESWKEVIKISKQIPPLA